MSSTGATLYIYSLATLVPINQFCDDFVKNQEPPWCLVWCKQLPNYSHPRLCVEQLEDTGILRMLLKQRGN